MLGSVGLPLSLHKAVEKGLAESVTFNQTPGGGESVNHRGTGLPSRKTASDTGSW